ncbi:MAG: C1 family peptidase, partial [Luteolibacter sp.]
RVTGYVRINNADTASVMQALANGMPVVFGSMLSSSYNRLDSAGAMPDPDFTQEDRVGGHCMVLVGYFFDQAGKLWFRVRNSWGKAWGKDGYHLMSAEYICNPRLSDDFWAFVTTSK